MKKINFNQLSIAWIVFTLGSVLVILFANLFFPRAVILGSHLASPLMAAIYAMGMVSIIAVGFMPIIEQLAEKKKLKLTSIHWLIIYWLINASAIWLMGRLAELVGLGLNSWRVAVALGLVIDLVQGGLMRHVVGKVKLK